MCWSVLSTSSLSGLLYLRYYRMASTKDRLGVFAKNTGWEGVKISTFRGLWGIKTRRKANAKYVWLVINQRLRFSLEIRCSRELTFHRNAIVMTQLTTMKKPAIEEIRGEWVPRPHQGKIWTTLPILLFKERGVLGWERLLKIGRYGRAPPVYCVQKQWSCCCMWCTKVA
jgi:hypothetical protein